MGPASNRPTRFRFGYSAERSAMALIPASLQRLPHHVQPQAPDKTQPGYFSTERNRENKLPDRHQALGAYDGRSANQRCRNTGNNVSARQLAGNGIDHQGLFRMTLLLDVVARLHAKAIRQHRFCWKPTDVAIGPFCPSPAGEWADQPGAGAAIRQPLPRTMNVCHRL